MNGADLAFGLLFLALVAGGIWYAAKRRKKRADYGDGGSKPGGPTRPQ